MIAFSHKTEKFWFWKSLKYFFYGIRKYMTSDLNTSHGKMSDFVSFLSLGFHSVIRMRNFEFESHWNSLIYFDKKIYDARFKYFPWKNIWFCINFIVWVHFSHKTEKFWFLKSLKHFNFLLSKKRKWYQIWICPVKQCLIWFKLSCLNRVLAISWEIRILNFIEIV